MPAPQSILNLVDKFERNLDAYRNGQYNETQVRLDFINPFFEALGWDMDNSLGYAEAYRDVIHEDAIKVGISTRAPDYSFRIGGQRKFFLEAKKPSVNLKDDIEPAFQLRRYGWSAKLLLSVLTDFDEFAVYDCRQKPDKNDKASKSRLFYCSFRDYADKWDEIAAIFSKDAVLKGSFDKYAVSTKGKRGTTEVDNAFLEEIENWRNHLAHNIALRNSNLTQRELNFAVQQTIDRIIFLRICEDRGIETYGRLMALQNGSNVYSRLSELFHEADDRYNSGLFHFKREKGHEEAPDELTLNLVIDDKQLKEIFNNLYYPDCPYEFSVLGADILGSVYEQFLGKVIRLTAGNRAVVEDKPEVKKAGGVYYTPTYIVDYIVAHTVGKLLEGKTPKLAAGITILDPACGSGSFLIGAYQYLLNWYLKQYLDDGANKYAKGKSARLYQSAGGVWRLTTAERKRILLEHIYGVDIDAQAVEVTKLSLLLKVLEGESDQTLTSQMKLFHERVLPDLAHNIQCGNSLIGSDFYDGQLDLDAEDALRINVFDWQAAFPQIFKISPSLQFSKGGVHSGGGFDVVIGNPPWGAEFTVAEKEYFRNKFDTYHVRTPESFNYFVAQMWELTNKNGNVGTIIPSSFLNQHEFWKTRKVLVDTVKFYRICILGDGVFKKVTAPSCILVFQISNYKRPLFFDFRKSDRSVLSSLLTKEELGQDALLVGRNSEGFILQVREGSDIIQKCNRWPKLRELAEEVATGVSSGLDKAYVYTPDKIKELHLENDLLRKLIVGGEIGRYWLRPNSGKKIIYVTADSNIEKYPRTHAALLPYRDQLKVRREAANGKIPWYSLNWPRRQKLFELPKILIRQTSDHIMASYDADEWYCLKSGIIVQLPYESKVRYEYLLGLLNSRLIKYVYDDLVGEQARIFPEVKPVQLFKLPIRTINFSVPFEKIEHDKLVKLVEKILNLHKQISAAKTPQDSTLLQRQITATDHQIDQLVYQLYDLTEEDISHIENA